MSIKKYIFFILIFILITTIGCNNADDNPLAPEGSTPSTNTDTETQIDTDTDTSIHTNTSYLNAIENTSNWQIETSNFSNNSLSASGISLPETFNTLFDYNAYNYSIDQNTAIKINLGNQSLGSIRASDPSFDPNNVLTIDEAGTYILSGNLNGHVYIKGDLIEGVTLVLNNVNINGQKNCAIYNEKKSTPLSIILMGTNSLNDVSTYEYINESEPSACLFSNGDLTIKGDGSLIVKATSSLENAASNGIESNGDNGIAITGGTIIVTTVGGNAIKSKSNIAIDNNAQITLTTGGKGDCLRANGDIYLKTAYLNLNSNSGGNLIKAENDWEEENSENSVPLGSIYIENGSVLGTAYNDGLIATKNLVIAGGKINIITTNENYWSSNNSSKGIKVGCDKASGTILITGGQIVLDTKDDAIKSTGPIDIKSNPAMRITASYKYKNSESNEYVGGKAITSDGNITIGDTGNPIIRIFNAEVGMESKTKLTICGGDIKLNTWNNGLNVVDPGTDLIITGGKTYIHSNGDGIYSNKNITITDGSTVINSDSTNGKLAIDFGGILNISGGTVIAVGPSDINNNKQNYGSLNYVSANGHFNAGMLIHMQDDNGNSILDFIPAQYSSSFKFASSSLKTGSIYYLYTGGDISNFSSIEHGIFNGGIYKYGTLFDSASINSTNTIFGASKE